MKNSKKNGGLKFAKSYAYEAYCRETHRTTVIYAVGVREAAETLAWLQYKNTDVKPVNNCTFVIGGYTYIFNRRERSD